MPGVIEDYRGAHGFGFPSPMNLVQITWSAEEGSRDQHCVDAFMAFGNALEFRVISITVI